MSVFNFIIPTETSYVKFRRIEKKFETPKRKIVTGRILNNFKKEVIKKFKALN